MKYESEVYEYLTIPENFETAWELSEQLNAVKDRLIEDFWNDVYSRLNELTEDEEWCTEPNVSYRKGGDVFIYLRDDKNIKVCFNNTNKNTYWGIWCNKSEEGYNWELFWNKRQNGIQKWDLLQRNDTIWPAWNYYGLDFTTLPGVIKLIKAERGTLVEETANNLVRIANDFKEEIEEVLSTKGN